MEQHKIIYSTPNKSNVHSSDQVEIYPNCEEEFRPKTGLTFESLKEGIDFYKAYAHLVGFSVRLSSEVKKDGLVHWKHVVCNKEGWHKEKDPETIELQMELELPEDDEINGEKINKQTRRRSIIRKRCKALCVFKMTIDGKYMILRVHEGHSHSHSHSLATPSKKPMLKSARKVNTVLKGMLKSYHRSNIGDSKAYNILRDKVGGTENSGCMRRDLQNFHRNIKKLLKNSNAHIFINNLSRMKARNPSFYYAYEVDEERRLKHAFWADGICRKNYALFGDAISFDTTYRTNKYSLIFVPFTGLNHHKQAITFGAAFLANEKEESFVWVFEKFLEVIGGQKPVCIITDQDPAMIKAIDAVFDTSIHRFCVWHIMRKVSAKVGGALNSNEEFHDKLKVCVWGSETPEEFETGWLSIISKYELETNDWFTQMFDMRNLWIPCYFANVYLAGLLRTISISESENSMFGNFLNKQLSLVEFWMRFDFAIEIQRENEKELDHANSSSIPKLKTDNDLEKHGRGIYTHTNFYIFQNQFWLSCMHCTVSGVQEENEQTTYVVVNSRKGSSKPRRQVTHDASTDVYSCSCKIFELEGIPCRHIIVVLKARCVNELPSSLISYRWTKDVTRKPIFDDDGALLQGCLKEEA